MSRLLIIDKLLKEYKLWTLHLKKSARNIENTLLQQDESDAIEEKIISIVISTIFTTIIGTFLNLFIKSSLLIWTIFKNVLFTRIISSVVISIWCSKKF